MACFCEALTGTRDGGKLQTGIWLQSRGRDSLLREPPFFPVLTCKFYLLSPSTGTRWGFVCFANGRVKPSRSLGLGDPCFPPGLCPLHPSCEMLPTHTPAERSDSPKFCLESVAYFFELPNDNIIIAVWIFVCRNAWGAWVHIHESLHPSLINNVPIWAWTEQLYI